MFEAIAEVVVFGFMCVQYLFFHRGSRRRNWYIFVGVMGGLACLQSMLRLGHLLGFWQFSI